MTPVAAALIAAVAVWIAILPGEGALPRLAAVPPQRRPRTRPLLPLLAVAPGLGAGLLAGPRGVAVAIAGTTAAVTLVRLLAGRAARRRAARQRAEVVHAGELMAGLLRVGRVPSAALAEAAADAPLLQVAAAEHSAGGEAGPALRRAAAEPGCSGLIALAEAWEISLRTGASLVEAVEAAAEELAAAGEVARAVDVELAGARLAGRMLALLPVVGLLLAYALGGDPVVFLTDSAPGWICLNLGVGLTCAGLLWIEAVSVRSGGR